MSDCSTQAMTPKEPQTLSNCCPYCGNPTPHANAIRNRQHSVDEAINDAWREKKSLEQRCQQLEQVVKRLWNFIAARADKVPQATYILGKTAEECEALGVDLNG